MKRDREKDREMGRGEERREREIISQRLERQMKGEN